MRTLVLLRADHPRSLSATGSITGPDLGSRHGLGLWARATGGRLCPGGPLRPRAFADASRFRNSVSSVERAEALNRQATLTPRKRLPASADELTRELSCLRGGRCPAAAPWSELAPAESGGVCDVSPPRRCRSRGPRRGPP